MIKTPNPLLSRSYFGLRSVSVIDVPSAANASATVKAPALNGKRIFYAGWLDQSFWPDGLYTPATPRSRSTCARRRSLGST